VIYFAPVSNFCTQKSTLSSHLFSFLFYVTYCTVSGVIFVYIHGAEGLTSGDQSECNPYCMLFNSRKKVT
jgi:hypothetical protein